MRRVSLCLAALAGFLVGDPAGASNYREVAKAVADDGLLQSAGVTPADARLRAQ